MHVRPFLKWPGGKFRLVGRIIKLLPAADVLVEPFVGSGSIFLNTDYKNYKLNDINRDLINVYKQLQKERDVFIQSCKDMFAAKYNVETQYYKIREKFNALKFEMERAVLFVYLNRHGYNGLCRYNRSKGEYNVPFGRYKNPYFPAEEMSIFAAKAQHATFHCLDYKTAMRRAKNNSVVYGDPPYVPLNRTAKFTQYYGNEFTLQDHVELTNIAKELARNGIPVLLSNHNIKYTRQLYENALLKKFNVRRTISCNPKNRGVVPEVLALFDE